MRSLLAKHMLRPKAVEAYDKTLNSVVADLINKLRFRRNTGGLVTDIASEFYRFGLEGESPSVELEEISHAGTHCVNTAN